MGRERTYFVYILASKRRVLYIGVTRNLEHRVWQHKTRIFKGFTSKYNVNQLVYYETFQYIYDAISREKQLKGLLRAKKIALIEARNPSWTDLAVDWYPVLDATIPPDIMMWWKR